MLLFRWDLQTAQSPNYCVRLFVNSVFNVHFLV